MSDPRDENCRRFTESGGLITGVELTHAPMPNAKYELVRAALIDEATARGTTIARVIVRDKDGIDAMASCWIAWPWTGQVTGSWDGQGLPGNANYPYEHIITNDYDPHRSQGPLAIYIGDAAGRIDSDVIAGLGLPGRHHIGFHLVFRERTGETPPPPPPPSPPTPSGDVAAQLQRIEEKLDRIARHFGLQV